MRRPRKATRKAAKVLAVASGGGHWVQLKRLLPAFHGMRISCLTTDAGYRSEVQADHFYVVKDANRWSKTALLMTALQVGLVLLFDDPDIVISTGAAPGYFAMLWGKLLGARTIWVDSMANANELSLSGKKAGRFADLWLTQWPHLARPKGPKYKGSVL